MAAVCRLLFVTFILADPHGQVGHKIGFVFLCPVGRVIAIISFQIRPCANFALSQIGFVFSKYDIRYITYEIRNTN